MSEIKPVIGFEIEHTATCDGKPHVITKEELPYNKDNPLWVGEHGNVQLDCVLAEVATNPTDDPERAWEMYKELLSTAKGLLPNVELSTDSVVEYEMADLIQSDDAMNIGCSASYSAYDGLFGGNITPDSYADGVRCAGVHVNIDFEGDEGQKIEFIKTLDYLLGIYSVNNWEQDNKEDMIERRKLYGSAGNYRLTDFGVEYRTLPSLIWTKENMVKIYDLVAEALSAPFKYSDEDGVQDCINNCEVFQ